MRWIVLPVEARCLDEATVGGKAAALAHLVRLNFPVPPFFVVAIDAFREIAKADIKDVFVAEIEQALGLLGGEQTPVAVRSSAIGEDAADASFAGLYHTELNVRGLSGVLEAVQHCWESYEGPAARAYRCQRPSTGREDAIAVIVQRMVEAEWSGVCFTANPVTFSLSQGVINAVAGLGDRLVSGDVNPEEITIERNGDCVVRQRASSQGARLPDSLVRAVWDLALQAECARGFPQDVEWAAEGDTVYILQSRPITTLGALYYNRYLEPWKDDPAARPDSEDRIWSRAYADEIWTPPVSPLFYNVQNLTPSFRSWWSWHHDPTPLPPDVFKYYRAAAYVDTQVLKRKFEYQPRFARIRGILNMFPSKMREEIRGAPFRWWGRLLRTLHFELRQRKLRSIFHTYRYLQQQWPEFVRVSDAWFELDLNGLSLEQLQQHLQEVRSVMARVAAPCVFAVSYHAHDLTFALTGLLERWFGNGDTLYAQVSTGLEGSKTVEEAQSLWELAARIRELLSSEEVVHVLDSNWESCRQLLLDKPGGPDVVQEFEIFWCAHRHRGANYKDLVFSRWGDDVNLLFNMVKGYIRTSTPSPREEHGRAAQARRRAQAELLRRLRGPLGPVKRFILRQLFRYNEIYLSERDNHRYYFDRVWYQLRRIYLSMGARLASQGVLDTPDDIFFLGAAEIEQALNGALSSAEARRRIAVRRAEWEQTLRVQPPKFLRGYSPYFEAEEPDTGHVLHGIGASPGIARGKARVVLTVGELPRVEANEIVIARQTDPGWTPVFARIRGLVLETGGVLAHGTSLCREYGLPCVTAVELATQLIPDGAEIEIDGAAGVVRVLTRLTQQHRLEDE